MKKLNFLSLIVVVVFLSTIFLATPVLATANPDVNRDGKVDWIDFCVVLGVVLFEPPLPAANADVDGNGIIDTDDLVVIRDYPGFDLEKELMSHTREINYFFTEERFIGDVNNDGGVDILDLSQISINFGQKGAEDLNRDGAVDFSDVELGITFFLNMYFILSSGSPTNIDNLSEKEAMKFLSFLYPEPAKVSSVSKLVATWGKIKVAR